LINHLSILLNFKIALITIEKELLANRSIVCNMI